MLLFVALVVQYVAASNNSCLYASYNTTLTSLYCGTIPYCIVDSACNVIQNFTFENETAYFYGDIQAEFAAQMPNKPLM